MPRVTHCKGRNAQGEIVKVELRAAWKLQELRAAFADLFVNGQPK